MKRTGWVQPKESFGDRYDKAMSVHRRSRELFDGVLTPEQLEDFICNGYFVVVGGVSNKRYRLAKYRSGNIHELDDKGSIVARHCAGPKNVPIYDFLVGQKLWLESEGELDFLDMANTHSY